MKNRFRDLRRIAQQSEETRAAGEIADRDDRELLAFDVTIATLDPEHGKYWIGPVANIVYAGAMLVDLAREGRITITGSGKRAGLEVADSTPLGNELLDDTLSVLAAGLWGTKVTRNLTLLGGPGDMVQRLVASGVMTVEESKALGVFNRRRFQALPGAGHDALVKRLRSVVAGEEVPDSRLVLLMGLLDAGGPLGQWIPKRGGKAAHARVRSLIEGDLVGSQARAILSAVEVQADKASKTGP